MAEEPPGELGNEDVLRAAGAGRCHCGEDRGGGGESQGDGGVQARRSRLMFPPLTRSSLQVKKSTKKVRVTVKPHLLFRVSVSAFQAGPFWSDIFPHVHMFASAAIGAAARCGSRPGRTAPSV